MLSYLCAACLIFACDPELGGGQSGWTSRASAPATRARLVAMPLPFEEGVAPRSAWIGLRLGPVPEPLAAHIQSGKLMITNVAVDSPADRAGLQRYDVILSANQTDIETMDEFVGVIQATGPGNEISLRVLRNGAPTTLKATLDKWRDPSEIEFKYEEPQETVVDQVLRGHILRQMPDGNWVQEYLGDLKHLPPLPPQPPMPPMAPMPGQRFRAAPMPGAAQAEVMIAVEEDGKRLEIRRSANGEFRVKRVENGEVSESVFPSAEAFQEKDPEAFDVFEQHTSASWSISVPRAGDLLRQQARWQAQVERALANAARARPHQFERVPDDAGTPGADVDPRSGTMTTTVREDGRIQVTLESANGSTTFEFKNEEDFKTRQPELYARFEESRKK